MRCILDIGNSIKHNKKKADSISLELQLLGDIAPAEAFCEICICLLYIFV